MRHWLWLHFTRDGRDERLAAKRYRSMLDYLENDPRMVEHRAKIKACSPHPNRAPNPAATAVRPPNIAERCLDCGIGIVTMTRLHPLDDVVRELDIEESS